MRLVRVGRAKRRDRSVYNAEFLEGLKLRVPAWCPASTRIGARVVPGCVQDHGMTRIDAKPAGGHQGERSYESVGGECG